MKARFPRHSSHANADNMLLLLRARHRFFPFLWGSSMKSAQVLWAVVFACACLVQSALATQHHAATQHAAAQRAETATVALTRDVVHVDFAEANTTTADTESGTALLVRKPIHQLSAAELASLRRGVEVMKQRSISDRTSWWYWANIHGTPRPSSDPLWRQCEHGSLHFLTWHRAYLYFFEQVLRDASGDPNLTLPYWEWQTRRQLPRDYRSPANSGNPLFDGSRRMNNGSSLPGNVIVDLNNALAQRSFSSFSRSLENSPHGEIHMLVGGNMGRVPTAARDPIFWSHHANVDRHWDRWLRASSSHQNPSDGNFLNRRFTFVDVHGNNVSITAGDVLDHHALGYRYADEPRPAGVASLLPQAGAEQAKSLGFAPETVKVELPPTAGVTETGQQRLLVDVVGIQFEQSPDFVYGIYLDLPAEPVSEKQLALHYVGSISFFGHGPDDHAHGEAGADQGFAHTADATAAWDRLEAAGVKVDRDATITLKPITLEPPDNGQASLMQAANIQSAAGAGVTYREIRVRLASDRDTDRQE